VTGYSFDRCYDDYRTGLLLAIYIAINAVGAEGYWFESSLRSQP
jgi:hypothetical protein